jgi:hypothetical protein
MLAIWAINIRIIVILGIICLKDITLLLKELL